MKRMIPILLICITAAWLAAADTPTPKAADPPRSPSATAAKEKYDLACKSAREDYKKALVAADQAYIEGLDTSLHIAMRDQDVQETERVHAALQSAADVQKEDMAPEQGSVSADRRQFLWATKLAWHWMGRSDYPISLSPNGEAACGNWPKLGSWSALDSNSISLDTPGGIAKITFAADRKAALWQDAGKTSTAFLTAN